MATPDRAAAARRHERAIPEEARAFQGERAGIVTRTVANLVDALVAATIVGSSYLGVAAFQFLLSPTSFTFPDFAWGLAILATGFVLGFIFWVAWASTGRTFGGHLMGLRVVNFRGSKLHWTGSLLRAGFCVLFPIGLFWAVVSRQNRSVQDTVMRTSVIYDWARGPIDSRRQRADGGGGEAGEAGEA
jgi:uncharacterized RDD family membrane protein YckC